MLTDYKSKSAAYYDSDRLELLQFIPRDSNLILDVGCGSGRFGQILKELRKCEVWGIEPNDDPAAVASTRLDKVYLGMFDSSLDLPKAKFDLICFNDVLEHMSDPENALSLSKALLKPGGSILVSVPNFRQFNNLWDLVVHGRAQYMQSGIMDKTHLRIFTFKSICNLISDTGFEISTISGINPQFTRRLFHIFNMFTFGAISDMRWLQIVIVAKMPL